MDPLAVLSGFGVGAIVGMTGVGGGSLMTPLLLGVFGLSPAVAIGTDLWFAGITKASGSLAHHRLGHIDHRVTRLLLSGSLPSTVLTIVLMHVTGISTAWSGTLAVALGVLVSLSSIGAGAIGATVLLLLYPRLAAHRIVGTDLAHAVPLTLVAGIGHATLGNLEWPLLGTLLLGSLPGIWLGARLTRSMPEQLLRGVLCASLVGAGFKVLS